MSAWAGRASGQNRNAPTARIGDEIDALMKNRPPWIRQRDASDNLAAALANLLSLLRVDVTLPTIRETLETHPHFPSLLSAADALREWRVVGQAFACRFEDLRNAPTPHLAHLRDHGGRFVAVERVVGGTVTIVDPETGRRELPVAEYARLFGEAVLLATPSPGAGETDYETKMREARREKALRLGTSAAAAVLAIVVLYLLASRSALATCALGLGLPALLWTFLRPVVLAARTATAWRQRYLRLRDHPAVVEALLRQEPAREMDSFPFELVLGNEEAARRLIAVVHPDCAACAVEYRSIEALVEGSPERFGAMVRFLCSDPESPARDFARETLALGLAGEKRRALKRLSLRFRRLAEGKRPVPKPARVPRYFFEGVEAEAERLLEAHASWARTSGVQATPTLFLDGRPVPRELRSSSLRALLRRGAARSPHDAGVPAEASFSRRRA
jgi:hypothetical protein